MITLATTWLWASLPFGLASSPHFNGFDVSGSTAPAREILHGGPLRDGIPALDRPKFVSAVRATYMLPDDRVMGLTIEGTSTAYLIDILTWHEIVNDRIGEGKRPVVVSYCPLCGSGVAFEARATPELQSLRFALQ